MPYRLLTDESVEDGIRRVITEQIERALAELNDSELGRHETVHQVRKRCKKIRGALRLVRPALGKAYAVENAWYRDAARRISDLRDAGAMIESYDDLADRFGDQVDGRVIRPIRDEFERRRQAAAVDADRADALLQAFGEALAEGSNRVAELTVDGDGCRAALAGMRKTYARARDAMDAVDDDSTPEAFHEWRKRTKYHWYHMRLLREVWPKAVRARRDEAKRLADLLGDHHDPCVMRAVILADADAFAGASGQQAFLGLISQRLVELERDSRPLGRRLLAEKPKHLARRFKAYLATWAGDG
mgnify:CR=1 FL=1